MSITGVAKPFLYEGQGVKVSGVAGQELNLAPQPLFAVSWSAVSVWGKYSTVGGISFITPCSVMYIGSLKSAMVGILAPWKLSNAVHQGCPFWQQADCYTFTRTPLNTVMGKTRVSPALLEGTELGLSTILG